MILATAFRSFAAGLVAAFGFRLRAAGLARLAAIAVDRTAAAQHHVGVFLLGRTAHDRGEMLERVAACRAESRDELDVAGERQHPVVLTLEGGLAMLWR